MRQRLLAAALCAGICSIATAQTPAPESADPTFRADEIDPRGPSGRPQFEIGPYREVQWDQGPSRPMGNRRNRPNVILILADDLGYNDVSFNGGGLGDGSVRTPNIDSIAREGVNFAQGYAGHGTCAPSRAAIMTGRYATRFGFEFTPVHLAMTRRVGSSDYGLRQPLFYGDREAEMIPYDEQAVPLTETMIPEVMRQAGYHTIQFGKWHLGEGPQYRPTRRGFAESLGFTTSTLFLPRDHPRVVESVQEFDPIDRFLWASAQYYVRWNDTEVFEPRGHMTDYLTEQAVAAIRANRNRPFFMYLAHGAPHTPIAATREDYEMLSHIEDHTERVYAAMVMQLDRGVGRILQTLQEEGLDNDTLIIFTSDNGGAYYLGLADLNRPFRGWKQTFFEGGIRVPYFMRWPGRIPAGTTYHAPVAHIDLAPTIAAAGRTRMPGDRVIDGVDLVPFVRGERIGRPHQTLVWRSGSYQVIREGDWKLQVGDGSSSLWLFDLANDPTERHNLAEARPEVVERLQGLLAAHNAEQAPPLWPTLRALPVFLDQPLNRPQTEDGEYIYSPN